MDYSILADEFMQKLYILNKARPMKRLNESMRGEMFVLHYLEHQDGPALPGDISGFMGVSTARIAVTLNNLEKKELITRQIDPEDRRRILVELTETGKKLAQTQQKEMRENLTQMIALLGEHDAREYVRISGKMAEFALQYKDQYPE